MLLLFSGFPPDNNAQKSNAVEGDAYPVRNNSGSSGVQSPLDFVHNKIAEVMKQQDISGVSMTRHHEMRRSQEEVAVPENNSTALQQQEEKRNTLHPMDAARYAAQSALHSADSSTPSYRDWTRERYRITSPQQDDHVSKGHGDTYRDGSHSGNNKDKTASPKGSDAHLSSANNYSPHLSARSPASSDQPARSPHRPDTHSARNPHMATPEQRHGNTSITERMHSPKQLQSNQSDMEREASTSECAPASSSYHSSTDKESAYVSYSHSIDSPGSDRMVIDEDRAVDSSASTGYMHHRPPSQHSLPEGPSTHDSRNSSPRISVQQSSDQMAPDSVFTGRSPKPTTANEICSSQADSSLYTRYVDNKGGNAHSSIDVSSATSTSGNNNSNSPGAASTQPYSHPVSSSQRSHSPEDDSSLMSPHVSSNANDAEGSPVLSSQYETLSDDD